MKVWIEEVEETGGIEVFDWEHHGAVCIEIPESVYAAYVTALSALGRAENPILEAYQKIRDELEERRG